MSSVTFFIVCLQAMLIQNVYCQILGRSLYSGPEIDLQARSSGAASIAPFIGQNSLLNAGSVSSGFDTLGLHNGIVSAGQIGGTNNIGLGLNNVGLGVGGINNVGLGVGGIGTTGLGLNGLGVNNVGLGIGGIANTGVLTNGINGLGVGGTGLLSNGLAGYGIGAGVADVAAVSSVPVGGPFVNNGEAQIVVEGDFAATGTTLVAGQVPVLGVVSYGGSIPASGVVSIAGNCACSSIPL